MKRTLKDFPSTKWTFGSLRDIYRYIAEDFYYDTPFAIYSDGRGATAALDLIVAVLCFAASTAVMFFGMYICTYSPPAPIPIYLIGLVFTTLYTVGAFATLVMVVMLAAYTGGYVLCQMFLIPLTVFTWVWCLLTGNTIHIRKN